MSLLDLLTAENVTTFNETRGERARVDLFAADLAEKNLRSVDLSGADVDKADLTGSDLTEAGLYKARMNGIDGTGMKLVDCVGGRIKLREAWLEDADLSGSDFSHGDLSEAVLTRTKGTGLRMPQAKLKAADATGAKWLDADLAGAHLSKAIFTDADLSRVDLTEAVGGELTAQNTRLDAAIGSGCRFPGSDFKGAVLKGARLDGANLSECDFTGADLTGADLTGANLTNAILKDALLTGAVFAEASLEGVDLEGMDLTDVDFTGLDADLLGLSDEQRDVVLSIGVPVNPDARLRPTKVASACSGDLVVGVWENADGEEISTLRYFARTSEGVVDGVLPVMASSVLDHRAVGTRAGVVIVLHRERPGGITLDTFTIGPDGRLAGTSSQPLGYPPMVSPVLVPEGDGFAMVGMARRGPTLVFSGPTDEGFGIRGSKPVPTARGFLGRFHPFLLCKGNALMPCTTRGVGNPFRAPDGFPGKHATIAFDGDNWVALWVQPPQGKDKGGIRAGWMVKRGAPEILDVTFDGAILSLDAVAVDGKVWLAWIELHGLGDTRVFVMPLDDGIPTPIPVDDIDHVAFARGPDGEVALVLTTDEEAVRITNLSGDLLGELVDA